MLEENWEENVPVHGADALVLEAVTDDDGKFHWARHLVSAIDFGRVGALLMVVLFGAVAYAVFQELERVTWSHVRDAIGAISWLDVAGACLATAVSYLALIGYDHLALRQVGAKNVPLRLVALTSFIAHAFTFSLGFGVLTGGAVRLRLYRSAGLDADRIVAVGILCSLTFWIGLAAVAGVALLVDPQPLHEASGFGEGVARGIGALILAGLAGWAVLTARRPMSLVIQGWTIALPDAGTTARSLLVGAADTAAAALALWLLLPQSAEISFAGFLVVFAVATVLGVISHVPGGFGVFDAAILLGLPQVPDAAMLASLLVFRVIYYVAPLVASAALLAAYELSEHAPAVQRGAKAVATAAAPLLPAAAATAVFLGGFVLLISGALPAESDRLALLERLVPLPFLETSHFIASAIGTLLLIVAHGLVGRLKSAWQAAVLLLGAGAVFSLMKGFDYEEALICLAVVGLLVAGRHSFYRQGGFLSGRSSSLEVLAIAVVVVAAIWIGFSVYRSVDYSNSLWWDFAYRGDAPRFLRASLGMAGILGVFAVYQLLHRALPMSDPAALADIEQAGRIVAASGRVEANLARLGDKRFVFSEAGDGFVMYGVQGRSWIAMGDPIAPTPEGAADLVWRFKELVDEHRGTPVFYQVTPQLLPVYLDAGFSLVKLGEEAWVDLAKFTLEGGEGRKLRQTYAKMERTGAKLEIVPQAEAHKVLEELRDLSDAWLDARGTTEKGFSLGFWSDAYIVQHDLAVVRHEGRAVAFANIWKTADKGEFSVDLMRHRPDAPQGIMDLLFIGLMQHAKAEGYRWFNLGMAPLSGLSQHRLASLWARFGTFFFRHADRLYKFEGLRLFKSKFKPEWRPKYLAYPGVLQLPQVLIDVVALIGAGPKRAAQRGLA
jgi:phosphatidylglycerol lysyltransferase